jgi:tripartite-type tricarboxylate transporter receptor subunit TctC
MLEPSLRRCASHYSKDFGFTLKASVGDILFELKGKGGMPQVHGQRIFDRRQIAAGLLASLAAPRAIRAEPAAAEFYRGKTVRILVGSPPGGGYDIYARLVAPALGQKLGATVLVENKDGNGGLAALATLLVRPADGLTIMNGSAEAAIISQMLARPGAIWDVTKLQWLAKMASAPKLWFAGKGGRYPSIADAMKADPLTWSATGPADDISDVQSVISYVLGLKSKIVTGYRGSGDMSLAVIRNEVDSGLLSADSALPHIDSIKPLALFGARRWKHLPDVPTLSEAAALPPDKTWIVTLREQIGEAQRAVVAAPGVPPDRVDYLRGVLTEVLTDPAVIEEGAKTNREIEYMSGADLQKLVGDLMKAAGPRLAEFHKIVIETYF